MTVTHHPGEELLIDFAAGGLAEPWSLAIATHLALCPNCRQTVADAEAVGGALLDGLALAAIDDDALDRVLARLDEAPPIETAGSNQAAPGTVLPEPLRSYVGGDLGQLRWRRLGFGASQVQIKTANDSGAVRLLRVPGGGSVPHHGHHGPELTVVLAGGFTDAQGHFLRGDLQQTDPSVRHQPRSDPGAPCISLTVTNAPLDFSSRLVRALKPWIGI